MVRNYGCKAPNLHLRKVHPLKARDVYTITSRADKATFGRKFQQWNALDQKRHGLHGGMRVAKVSVRIAELPPDFACRIR